MTPATLRFLRDLLAQQQISAQHPDLVALATMIQTAKVELDQAIEQEEGQ